MTDSILIREQTLEWQRRTIERLTKLVNTHYHGREATKMLRNTKNVFQGVVIDMLNGGDPKIGTVTTIRVIANKMRFKTYDVRKCLEWPKSYIPPDFIKKFIHEVIDARGYLRVQIDKETSIGIELPLERYEEILSYELPDNKMIHFIERYSFIMPELGFFWSIHPDGYEIIRTKHNKNTARIIEGFASPLNHNLDEWCSVYQLDTELGSLGTFQDVIKNTVTPKDKSIRWTVNPAYTELLIDISHRAIMDRMERYPEDEFFLLLPGWPDPPIIEWIIKNGECWYLEGTTYRVYDHIADETVKVPAGVNMFIGYVRSKEAKVEVVPFVRDVVEASYLEGTRPKMITMDDIRTNSVISIKL